MLTRNKEQARFNMAAQQIRPWEVLDQRVLDTMQEVPRENFVPRKYQGLAFADTEIPIGHGQSMMAPRLEARMLQALAVKSSDQVLEIGTGSGFITACLATLGNSVVSYDIHESFIEAAREHLALLGLNNVRLHTGNALDTDLPAATYDAIAVTGSLPEYDKQLEQLLAPGGRLFVVVGEAPIMEAILVTRRGDGIFQQENLFETDLPALEAATRPSRFIF